MEDAEGASSSRQPDDDEVTDPVDDSGGIPLPPPPGGVDPSGEIPAPARDDVDDDHELDEVAIEDAEVIDDDGIEPATEPDADDASSGHDDVVPAGSPDDDVESAGRPDGDVADPMLGGGPPAAERTPRSRPHLPTSEPGRSRTIAGIAIGAIAIVGLVGALIGGGDSGGDGEQTAGSDPTGRPVVESTDAPTTDAPTTDPPTTDAPASTEPRGTDPATTPAASVPTETVPDTATATPPPSPASVDPTTTVAAGATTLLADPSATTTSVPGTVRVVRSVVPDIAAFTGALDDVAQAQTIAELAVAPRNDIASPGPVGSLCAVVRLQEQAQLEGRWERDGSEVDATNLSTVGEPGFGDCLVGEPDAPLEEGTYQFVVADRDGNDSAAGTYVIGAVALEQIFVNTTGENVCALRLAPTEAGRYDAYDFTGTPLAPSASVIVPIADVDHDVRVDGCDPDADPIEEFDFNPAAGVPQSLDP